MWPAEAARRTPRTAVSSRTGLATRPSRHRSRGWVIATPAGDPRRGSPSRGPVCVVAGWHAIRLDQARACVRDRGLRRQHDDPRLGRRALGVTRLRRRWCPHRRDLGRPERGSRVAYLVAGRAPDRLLNVRVQRDREPSIIDRRDRRRRVERDAAVVEARVRLGRESWSPDSRFVAYAGLPDQPFAPSARPVAQPSDDGPPLDIFVIDADNGIERNSLTNSAVNEAEPQWSPDGSRLAYRTSVETFRERVDVVRMDGFTAVGLPAIGPVVSRYVSWSPDGMRLLLLQETASGSLDRGRSVRSTIVAVDPEFRDPPTTLVDVDYIVLRPELAAPGALGGMDMRRRILVFAIRGDGARRVRQRNPFVRAGRQFPTSRDRVPGVGAHAHGRGQSDRAPGRACVRTGWTVGHSPIHRRPRRRRGGPTGRIVFGRVSRIDDVKGQIVSLYADRP